MGAQPRGRVDCGGYIRMDLNSTEPDKPNCVPCPHVLICANEFQLEQCSVCLRFGWFSDKAPRQSAPRQSGHAGHELLGWNMHKGGFQMGLTFILRCPGTFMFARADSVDSLALLRRSFVCGLCTDRHLTQDMLRTRREAHWGLCHWNKAGRAGLVHWVHQIETGVS